MSVDSIGNFLTAIRNSVSIADRYLKTPYSKLKEKILEILLNEGFIKGYNVEGELAEKKIVVFFKYVNNESVIHQIQQISKPGRRIYARSSCIPIVIGGLGIAILTTNKGLMTNKQVVEHKIGGEIICTVW
jgi:small subunit ribosomal protein S8